MNGTSATNLNKFVFGFGRRVCVLEDTCYMDYHGEIASYGSEWDEKNGNR